MSLLEHAPSFFGQFSHDTIIVAPSLSFEIMLFDVVFIDKNTNKNKYSNEKKNLLPHPSTTETLDNIIQT